jgi:hypothetical protein
MAVVPSAVATYARLRAMTDQPFASVLEPRAIAAWLDADIDWVMRAIEDDGLPVLGYRSDGTPLLAVDEVRAWLRRPTLADDET